MGLYWTSLFFGYFATGYWPVNLLYIAVNIQFTQRSTVRFWEDFLAAHQRARFHRPPPRRRDEESPRSRCPTKMMLLENCLFLWKITRATINDLRRTVTIFETRDIQQRKKTKSAGQNRMMIFIIYLLSLVNADILGKLWHFQTFCVMAFKMKNGHFNIENEDFW